MSAINNGGPAYPVAPRESAAGDWIPGSDGMSLRDWFAGQALVGILSNQELLVMLDQHQSKIPTCDAVSMNAFVMADAMLKAREK